MAGRLAPLPRDRERLLKALALTPQQRPELLERMVSEMRLIRQAAVASKPRRQAG